MTTLSLRNRRLLVLEDEYLIAEDIRRELEREGAIVIGPVPSVGKALRLIESQPDVDAAILDVNLGGEKSFPVAAALQSRHVPFVFMTGYNAVDIPREWRHVIRLEKPFQVASATRALGTNAAT